MKRMDFEQMARIWERRQRLIRNGWSIRTEATTGGWGKKTGLTVWISRSEWHGKNTYTLTGSAVTFFGTSEDTDDIIKTEKLYRLLEERAEQAWEEYTDSVPCQGTHGRIMPAVMFRSFEEGKDSVGRADKPEEQQGKRNNLVV